MSTPLFCSIILSLPYQYIVHCTWTQSLTTPLSSVLLQLFEAVQPVLSARSWSLRFARWHGRHFVLWYARCSIRYYEGKHFEVHYRAPLLSALQPSHVDLASRLFYPMETLLRLDNAAKKAVPVTILHISLWAAREP